MIGCTGGLILIGRLGLASVFCPLGRRCFGGLLGLFLVGFVFACWSCPSPRAGLFKYYNQGNQSNPSSEHICVHLLLLHNLLLLLFLQCLTQRSEVSEGFLVILEEEQSSADVLLRRLPLFQAFEGAYLAVQDFFVGFGALGAVLCAPL